MKKLLLILAIVSLGSLYAQEKLKVKGLTRKEIKAIKKQQKEQDRIAKYSSMGLNQWGIDENAQTWYLALKFHLPSSRQGDGIPILRQYQSFTEESSRIYPLWIIDGQQFNSPPVDVLALSPLIRKVRILVSAAETNRWGKQARAGVIVLETAR
ncbi:MAG: hypothetical protein CBD39_00610 [Flavobacteriaceae bacterium TMED179]|nr:MAG: hypothetical protein CBD39_00610 [Flavobacteriaceae bacterium TMED179]|tara:strand:- start:402 stop:863 length:462 start_codon:yes stop_codon:yes gene_type:complete